MIHPIQELPGQTLSERDFAFSPPATLEVMLDEIADQRLAPMSACTLTGDSSGSVGSVTGMPAAVLAEIGCRTLRTVRGRRTIIVSEGAGQGPRPVIVLVADFVG